MAMTEKELQDILDRYPSKVQKNRKKHILIKDGVLEQQEIEANTSTVPGIMTNRGCAYAGCKGVVVGPLKDMVHIVHGPIGCSYYAWGARRNKARTEEGGTPGTLTGIKPGDGRVTRQTYRTVPGQAIRPGQGGRKKSAAGQLSVPFYFVTTSLACMPAS